MDFSIIRTTFCIICTFIALTAPVGSESFDDCEVIQFITSNTLGPANILELDNNREIFLACEDGETKAGLEAMGTPVTSSQLRLMLAWRILGQKGDTLYSILPILDQAEMLALRNITAALAPRIIDVIEPEVKGLIRVLTSRGRAGNTYAILFSYVLDGMVWDRFVEDANMPARKITVDEPFWAGEVWVVCPGRRDFPGTNTISDQGWSMSVCWSEQAIPKMLPFVADWENLTRMFDDFVKYGQMRDTAAQKVFAPFNLYDESGVFTLPVIEEQPGEKLFEASKAIAAKLTQETPRALDISKLTKRFGFRDEAQALVIAYHELIWDMIDELVDRDLLEVPLPFADPEQASSKDIGDLIFFVKSSR